MIALKQPMTARQLGFNLGMNLDSCSYALWELKVYELVSCLNESTRRSRLYWLTELGQTCQRKLFEEKGLPLPRYDFPQVDWDLYGWICYSHRAAVVKALEGEMQPAAIKRRARFQDPGLKMSAKRGKAHPHYELTELGKTFQNLVLRVGT